MVVFPVPGAPPKRITRGPCPSARAEHSVTNSRLSFYGTFFCGASLWLGILEALGLCRGIILGFILQISSTGVARWEFTCTALVCQPGV